MRNYVLGLSLLIVFTCGSDEVWSQKARGGDQLLGLLKMDRGLSNESTQPLSNAQHYTYGERTPLADDHNTLMERRKLFEAAEHQIRLYYDGVGSLEGLLFTSEDAPPLLVTHLSTAKEFQELLIEWVRLNGYNDYITERFVFRSPYRYACVAKDQDALRRPYDGIIHGELVQETIRNGRVNVIRIPIELELSSI